MRFKAINRKASLQRFEAEITSETREDGEHRVSGNLFYDDVLQRKFNVKVANRRFSLDIGTGSGVKVTFSLAN